MPEIEEDIGEELDEDERKFSIRALNFNMMSKLLSKDPSLLARASSKLISYRGTKSRLTVSARKTNQMGKPSRLSKAPLSGRDSDIYFGNNDEASINEDSDF